MSFNKSFKYSIRTFKQFVIKQSEGHDLPLGWVFRIYTADLGQLLISAQTQYKSSIRSVYKGTGLNKALFFLEKQGSYESHNSAYASPMEGTKNRGAALPVYRLGSFVLWFFPGFYGFLSTVA